MAPKSTDVIHGGRFPARFGPYLPSRHESSDLTAPPEWVLLPPVGFPMLRYAAPAHNTDPRLRS